MTRAASVLGAARCRAHPPSVLSSDPTSLPENDGLAFLGETVWPPARVTEREAKRPLATPNICGRPNADVVRRRLAVIDGEPGEDWQLDFPAHFTVQEASLYEQPFAVVQKRSGGTWLNPHLQSDLRRALARVSRWLAMPAEAAAPDWRWIEDELLPDASLVVVARDDDFTHGVLSSQAFRLWHQTFGVRLGPVRTVESFPFPWPPATALSALTAEQEEQRHAIARAARSGNNEQLNASVSAAYGWAAESDGQELVENLSELHRRRAG
jgi:hypothetical protein